MINNHYFEIDYAAVAAAARIGDRCNRIIRLCGYRMEDDGVLCGPVPHEPVKITVECGDALDKLKDFGSMYGLRRVDSPLPGEESYEIIVQLYVPTELFSDIVFIAHTLMTGGNWARLIVEHSERLPEGWFSMQPVVGDRVISDKSRIVRITGVNFRQDQQSEPMEVDFKS